MKSLTSEWRKWVCAGLLSLCVACWTAGTAVGEDSAASVASGPVAASSASTSTSQAEADVTQEAARQLALQGLEKAQEGHYDQALAELNRAAKDIPDDQKLPAAIAVLKQYKSVMDQAEVQRKREYDNAVEQVRKCMFAQEELPKLGDLEKPLRAKILGNSGPSASTTAPSENSHDVASAYNRAGNSESLSTAVDKEAADKLKMTAAKSLQEASSHLQEAVNLLKDNDGEYAVMFRKLAGKLSTGLAAYSAAWEAVKTDDAKGRAIGARQLRKIEDDLTDSLMDLESIVTEKPWLMALTQARMAVLQLVPTADRDKVSQEPWYRDLVSQVEKLGKSYIDKGNWYEALAVYSNLQELAPDVEKYKETAKIAQRHSRVLKLYGQKPSTQPTTTQAAEDAEPGWRELVSGVDVEMVRTAISQLNDNYVDAVDYRKLARGALTAVKILVSTPDVVNTFPTLADKAKLDEFIASIDELQDEAQKKERMDYMELQLILNGVLRASQRTVDIPADVLSVEFADGFLEELDKFSNLIWPYELPDFKKQTMGEFFGVGIQIGKEPGEPLKVLSPLEDSPAYKAGIKTGDLILTVDGQRTEPLNVDALVKKITGPKDTKVVLGVKSPGLPPRDVPLIREEIRIRTVKGWQRRDGGDWDYMIDPAAKIGYVRLSQFTDQTIKELQTTLEELRKDGVKSLILDLRFDPGGLLRSAGNVADEFLRSGRIVSTRGRQSGESEIDATGNGEFQEGDLVVLINQYSASAAEILAGALKDWHRATVVGVRSYGKGSVQNVIYISRRKAVLKVTTAYYYLPSGRCLHRKNGDKEWGVDPDVEVLLTPKQSRHWLDLRRKTDLLQDYDADQLRQDMAEQLSADVQLNTAVFLLKLKQYQEKQPQEQSTKQVAGSHD